MRPVISVWRGPADLEIRCSPPEWSVPDCQTSDTCKHWSAESQPTNYILYTYIYFGTFATGIEVKYQFSDWLTSFWVNSDIYFYNTYLGWCVSLCKLISKPLQKANNIIYCKIYWIQHKVGNIQKELCFRISKLESVPRPQLASQHGDRWRIAWCPFSSVLSSLWWWTHWSELTWCWEQC